MAIAGVKRRCSPVAIVTSPLGSHSAAAGTAKVAVGTRLLRSPSLRGKRGCAELELLLAGDDQTQRTDVENDGARRTPADLLLAEPVTECGGRADGGALGVAAKW